MKKKPYTISVLILMLAFTLIFNALPNGVSMQSTNPSKVMTMSDSPSVEEQTGAGDCQGKSTSGLSPNVMGVGSQSGSESAVAIGSDPAINVTVSCYDINGVPLYLASVLIVSSYGSSSGFTNRSGVFKAINVQVYTPTIDVCVSWGNASAPGQPGYYMYLSGIDATSNVEAVVNASDLRAGGSLAKLTLNLRNSTGGPMLDTRLFMAFNAIGSASPALGMGPVTDTGGVATLYLSNATWAPASTYYTFLVCQMTPSNNTLSILTDQLVTSDKTVTLTMPNPSQMASIDLTFSSPTGISLMDDIRSYFEFSSIPPEVNRDDLALMSLPSKLDGKMLFTLSGGGFFLPVADDGTTRLCINASLPFQVVAIFTNTTNVSGGPWLYIPYMGFDSLLQGVVEHVSMGGAYLKLRYVTPTEAYLGSTPKLSANFTDEFHNPLELLTGNGSTSFPTGMQGPLAYFVLYNLTIRRPDNSLWYNGQALQQSGGSSILNGILAGIPSFPSLDVLGTYTFSVSIDTGPWQLNPPGTTSNPLTGNFEVIEAQALATFRLDMNTNVWTEGDTLSSGNYMAGSYITLWIDNQDEGTDTTLGNLRFNATAGNINWVNYQEYANWNSSHVNWAFPPDFVISENQGFGTSFGVDKAVQLNMTLSRVMNQTVFDADGYQMANFTVTFTDTDFLWSNGNINANEQWMVNASIVPGTFQTDAPLNGLYEGTNYVNFNFNKALIQVGVSYNCSVVIKVDLTGNAAPPIQYKPNFSVACGVYQESRDAGEGYTVEVPLDMLPSYITSVQASTNTSNTWTIERNDYVGGTLFEVSKQALDLSDFPSPFAMDGTLDCAFVVGDTWPHGSVNWGAWTVDVLGAIGVSSRLGQNAWSGVTYQFIDSDVASYNSSTGEAEVYWSKIPSSNVISVGSSLVNIFAYHYEKFGGAPFYMSWVGGQPAIHSNLTGQNYLTGWGYDYAVINIQYDDQNGRYILLVYGVTGKGSQAACMVLQHPDLYGGLLTGRAVIIKWQDLNYNGIVDTSDGVTLIESWP